jgi:cardiolipin synthase
VAQAIGTGPTVAYGAMNACFAAMIHAARRSLTITTPYFVPGEQVLTALVSAARRGVAVTLIVPRRNDSRFVAAASRSYYPSLLEAGVQIFEFLPGLLHAKTMVADDSAGIIGSANLDRRSFELNFENNILFADATWPATWPPASANGSASAWPSPPPWPRAPRCPSGYGATPWR